MVTAPKMLYWNKRCLGPPKHLSFIKKNLFHDIFRRLWSCTGEESNFAVKFNLCGTPVNEVSRYNLAYVSFLLISLNLFVFINKNRKCSTADDLLKRVTNWGHFIPDCASLCKVFINFLLLFGATTTLSRQNLISSTQNQTDQKAAKIIKMFGPFCLRYTRNK